MKRVARRRSASAAGAQPARKGSPRPAPPGAEVLRKGAQAIHAATSPAGVIRALLSAAIQLCGARGAVWWQREDGSLLTATTAQGVRLPRKSRQFRPKPAFWTPGRRKSSPVLRLSPAQAQHADFLSALNASQAVLVRARRRDRWIGALSVQDGDFSDANLDLLTDLTRQAALALSEIILVQENLQLARGQRKTISEIGLALSSALSLDDLLRLVCRSAASVVQSDLCFIFLSDDDGRLRLRARETTIEDQPEVSDSVLLDLAERARTQRLGHPLWLSDRRLPGPGGAALRQAGFRSLLGLPLAIRGEPLGVLLLVSRQPNAFAAAQRHLILSFGAQAAVAIENLGLIENMQHRLLELADLSWLSTHIVADLDVAKIASTVASAASKAVNVPKVTLFLVGPRGEHVPIPAGQFGLAESSPEPLPPEGHLGADALASGAPQIVADADEEGRADDPLIKRLGARSLVCIPMTAQHGMRGLFVVADDRPRPFRSHSVVLLSGYASQTALALQSALLYEDVTRHLDQLSRLFDISQLLASSLELSETLDAVLSSASEFLHAPACSIMLLDPKTKDLLTKATRGMDPDPSLYLPLREGEGLAGRAAQAGTLLVSTDLTRDGRFKFREMARQEGLQTAIAAPLIARGRTVGVLNLYRTSSRRFTKDDQRLLTPFANSAAVAIENANLYQEAQESSQFFSAMTSELNHRMRNTLQTIAGLLRLELDQPQVRATEEAIRRAISRIQAVAVVQDLVPSREVQFVDLKQAARRIVELATQALGSRHVETKVSGTRVMLPSQTATTVALIFAELIDNALRHGLARSQDGRLTVSLAEAGGDVVIQVRDNGIGPPPDLELDDVAGLGLKIVRGLVEEELGGKLEFEARDGLTARARFPKR
jgi:GAF domain-containing protein